MNGTPLDDLDDEELGELVRNTAAFRAAAACARFADEAQELRSNDSLAYDRLVRETHDRQGTSVTKRGTTAEIVATFLDVVEDHAALAEHPADTAEDAADEVVDP
ncbi:hypothetical protein [Haloplanus rubicundus]|uniref:Uncharacterized protein n=1 Tax=Haloplanus rubicundus TaxID=1547898 RepID=A0A345EBC6_9EURY|nr:hypothetical protein [Haloplanus rubicundus]AXG09498.1 hypothetical protein DU484_06235 [Haloplanus rubicundus]